MAALSIALPAPLWMEVMLPMRATPPSSSSRQRVPSSADSQLCRNTIGSPVKGPCRRRDSGSARTTRRRGSGPRRLIVFAVRWAWNLRLRRPRTPAATSGEAPGCRSGPAWIDAPRRGSNSRFGRHRGFPASRPSGRRTRPLGRPRFLNSDAVTRLIVSHSTNFRHTPELATISTRGARSASSRSRSRPRANITEVSASESSGRRPTPNAES